MDDPEYRQLPRWDSSADPETSSIDFANCKSRVVFQVVRE